MADVNIRKSKAIDLTGQVIGRWKVLERAENSVRKTGVQRVMWLCECQCENKTIKTIFADALHRRRSLSCGCLSIELVIARSKKYNIYDISGEYGIGYTSNTNHVFYFDLEDYPKIKDYCWSEDERGYIYSTLDNKKRGRIHRFLLNPKQNTVVDHINHLVYDNRKSNLRICLQRNNSTNRHKQKNNTSGRVGVIWVKSSGLWKAQINIDLKSVPLGYFKDFEDAVKARKEAEDKYYGEYRYIKENDERLINNV